VSRARFHWVGPLPPAQTDIAHYTARILPALAERAEVVLWTDAEAWDPALEAHARVRRYDWRADFPMPLDGLAPLDGPEIPVFQIGNSWLFHSGPLNLARRVPGVVVLHDLAIQDLLRGMIEHGAFAARVYAREMAHWHGARGRQAARGLGEGGFVAVGVVPGDDFAFEADGGVPAVDFNGGQEHDGHAVVRDDDEEEALVRLDAGDTVVSPRSWEAAWTGSQILCRTRESAPGGRPDNLPDPVR